MTRVRAHTLVVSTAHVSRHVVVALAHLAACMSLSLWLCVPLLLIVYTAVPRCKIITSLSRTRHSVTDGVASPPRLTDAMCGFVCRGKAVCAWWRPRSSSAQRASLRPLFSAPRWRYAIAGARSFRTAARAGTASHLRASTPRRPSASSGKRFKSEILISSQYADLRSKRVNLSHR